ncbi:MAG TPA: hypothetical protein VF815_01075 [Myxococcaceae bacterium]|jgi:hypothetical protein
MQRTVIAALLLLASCAPPTEDKPKVRALVIDSKGTGYAPTEVTLNTVTDIVAMEGTVAKIIGGASIRVDSEDPELQNAPTEEAFGEAMIKNEGSPVKASYIDHEGVLWPADFHTWNIVTAYYNLEKAFEYFQTVGRITLAEFGEPTTVYYFPEFVLKDSSSEPGRDNALFFPPVQALMVLPFDELQKAPLAINAGIMTHEYSHLIFNKKVYGGRRLPEALLLWGNFPSSPGANLLKALDEGLADYHGFGTTCKSPSGCDTKFMRTSFDDTATLPRDLADPNRCMTEALRQQLATDSLTTFSGNGREYALGSIIASSLYHAGQSLGRHEILQGAIVASYSDKSDTEGFKELIARTINNQNDFTLVAATSVIINHVYKVDPELATAVCNQFIDRLQIPANRLVGVGGPCPPDARGGVTTCRTLPPSPFP